MTFDQIEQMHKDYRRAFEVAHDESAEQETRDAAVKDACDLRLMIDAAVAESLRAIEIGQARSAMDDILRPAGQPAMTVDPFTRSLMDFVRQPERGVTPPKRGIEVPWSGKTAHTSGIPQSAILQTSAQRANEEWFHDTGSTVKAGYLGATMVEYMTNVIWHENAESAVLQSGVTFVDTPDGRQLQWPKLSTDASSALTAERTAATLTYPVWAPLLLDSYRYDGYMTLTEAFVRDSIMDVWPIVNEVAARASATIVASELASADGSAKPNGLANAATSGKTAAAKTTFTFSELQDLYLSLLPGARARGSWIAGSTAYGIIMKMVDDNGRPMMQPAIAAGLPDTLMGKPIREDASYPACTTGLCPVTYGDVSSYHVRRIGGFRIERDDSVYFTQFETVVRFSVNIDADLLDTAKVKKLTLG